MLDHGEKECLESTLREENGEKGNAQYGPWLRGEPGRRANRENKSMDEGNGLKNKYMNEGAAREMRVLSRKNTVPERQGGTDGNTCVEKSRSLVHSPRLCTEATGAGGRKQRSYTRMAKSILRRKSRLACWIKLAWGIWMRQEGMKIQI